MRTAGRQSRHLFGTRLAFRSHEWVVRWLVKHGWTVESISLPTRASVLEGSTNPGWTRLAKPHIAIAVNVPGARRPKERLSIHEWKVLMTDLDVAYKVLGVRVPPLHNLSRKDRILAIE